MSRTKQWLTNTHVQGSTMRTIVLAATSEFSLFINLISYMPICVQSPSLGIKGIKPIECDCEVKLETVTRVRSTVLGYNPFSVTADSRECTGAPKTHYCYLIIVSVMSMSIISIMCKDIIRKLY